MCVAGKEYVGIVRLHNAIESEHALARVSLTAKLKELRLFIRSRLNVYVLTRKSAGTRSHFTFSVQTVELVRNVVTADVFLRLFSSVCSIGCLCLSCDRRRLSAGTGDAHRRPVPAAAADRRRETST